jgi:hypothetical protein
VTINCDAPVGKVGVTSYLGIKADLSWNHRHCAWERRDFWKSTLGITRRMINSPHLLQTSISLSPSQQNVSKEFTISQFLPLITPRWAPVPLLHQQLFSTVANNL